MYSKIPYIQLRRFRLTRERDTARHYSTRDFFRQMPNALLARYFQARGLFGDLDFSAMDPHLKSTTHGIDGLMVELDASKSELVRATIFEDKCSEDPRRMFRDEILPSFADHHAQARAGTRSDRCGIDRKDGAGRNCCNAGRRSRVGQ